MESAIIIKGKLNMRSRPDRSNPKVIEKATAVALAVLVKWEPESLEDWEKPAKEIAERSLRLEDGYALAKFLDDTYMVEVDTELVNLLDDLHFALNEVINGEVRAWVIEENIQCQFTPGQKVMFSHRWHKDVVGIVDRIDAIKAKITVIPPSDIGCQGKPVLNFEDCKLVEDKQL